MSECCPNINDNDDDSCGKDQMVAAISMDDPIPPSVLLRMMREGRHLTARIGVDGGDDEDATSPPTIFIIIIPLSPFPASLCLIMDIPTALSLAHIVANVAWQ